MGEESRKIEACVVGVGVLWAISLALLIAETAGGPVVAGRWSLFVAATAAVWTVIISMARARRRVVQAIARELAVRQLDDEPSAPVRPVR